MRFMVIERHLCPKCSGLGITRHPLWDKFWAVSKLGTVAELQTFMADNGAANVVAEAMPCAKCGGTGHDDREISLSEALAKLGEAHGCKGLG